MRLIFSFLLFLIFSITSFSQIIFQKAYGGPDNDAGAVFQETVGLGNEGFILSGSSNSYGILSPSGWATMDFYLLRLNQFGDTLWTGSFGGDDDDVVSSVLQTADQGFVAVGRTQTFGAGGNDIYLVKVSSSGTFLWSRTFGGNVEDVGNSVMQAADGGFIVAGNTTSFGSGTSDPYLIRTDSDGYFNWSKTVGGSYNDVLNSAASSADGGFILVGRTSETNSCNLSFNTFLVKTDSTGSIQWARSFGGTAQCEGMSVKQTPDGGFVFIGYMQHAGTGNDVFIGKADSNGNPVWIKALDFGINDVGYSVEVSQNGDLLFSGFVQSSSGGYEDAFLIKMDSGANLLWSSVYGNAATGVTLGSVVKECSDHGFAILGGIKDTASGVPDVYLIKTDSDGHSGCNESSLSPSVSAASSLSCSLNFQVSGGGTQSSPVTKTRRGSVVTQMCFSAGVGDLGHAVSSLGVYPNPTDGKLFIKIPISISRVENSKLLVSNIFGENVGIYRIAGEYQQIDLSNEPAGIYFIRLESAGNVLSGKVVVRH